MAPANSITPRILVTTDFSEHSKLAFYHALAAAVRCHGRLTLLHTGAESRDAVPWERFPGVRETLARWGLIAADAPRTAVLDELDVGVAKMAMRDANPRNGITDYLHRHPADLLVMATEGRTGLARIRHPSVAESVSYRARSHTLMLPKDGATFVDPTTGESSLRNVLCVLNPAFDPHPALTYLAQWLPTFGAPQGVDIHVIDTLDDAGEPPMLPARGDTRWHWRHAPGDIVDVTLSLAAEQPPDLIVLHASSPLSLRGRMRGSHIDKLLATMKLPLLSLPRV